MRAWLLTGSIVAHVAIIRLASGFWEIERVHAEPELVQLELIMPSPIVQPEWRKNVKPVYRCSGCTCDLARWQRIDNPKPPELCIQVFGRILCLPPWDTPQMLRVGGG